MGRLKQDLEGLNERVDSITMCSAFLKNKMEQYEAKQPDLAMTNRDVREAQASATIAEDEGLAAVQQVAHDRVEEVASGVASVLGEEMRTLERRQRDQQRAMSQMMSSLTGLRSLVGKLSQTCSDVANFTMVVARDEDQFGQEPSGMAGMAGTNRGGEMPAAFVQR